MTGITHLYSIYIKPLAIRVGLHHLIKRLYWWAKITQNPIQQAEVAGTSVQFNITNKIEYARHQNLGGEEKILGDILSELDSDDIVYDVGANVGAFTCFLAKRLNSDQVVAFEPHPSNINSLQSNLRLNNVDAIIMKKALSDKNGTAELAVASEEAGEGKHALARGKGTRTIEIELATGDQLVNNGKIPNPTVIKIDVEGAEYQVLKGLKGIFERGECRLCYVEIHPDRISKYDATLEDIDAFFKSYDYTTTELQGRGSEYFVKATKC